jgi:hypothetical protein
MHKILIYLHIIYLLKSSPCFEHYPAHLQEVYVVIVYMQPLVSSLSAVFGYNFQITILHRAQESNKVVDVTTRLWAESNVKSWLDVRQRKGTFPPKRTGWFWVQPTLVFSDGRGPFPRDKAPGVEAGYSPPPPRSEIKNV